MNADWDDVWKKKKVTSDYSLKLYDFLRNYKLKENSRVLEIGCGSGGGLKQFKNQFVVGVDLSEESLKLSKGNLVNADLFKLPFKDNSFDLVYSSGLLEHFKIEMAREALLELSRVCRGDVVVIVPNSHCLWYRIFKKTMKVLGKWDFGYEEDYSVRRLRKLSKGFKVKRFFGLQAFLPLATNNYEILPVSVRKMFVGFEKIFPFKQYYAYAVGVILE